jgi:hypothetical protein
MSEQSPLELDLKIERADDDGAQPLYRAEVLVAALGASAERIFTLPFSDLEIENVLLRLGRPMRGVRSTESAEQSAAREFGARLFEAVFAGATRDCLGSALDEAQRRGAGVRLRLRLTRAPELADLPWEYLYHPERDLFLALSEATLVVRSLDIAEPVRPLRVAPPLRILALIAAPQGAPPLDTAREQANLATALQPAIAAGRITLDIIPHATLSLLEERLRQPYHVLHFIGHGMYDERTQENVLLFEDAEGYARRVSGDDLRVVLDTGKFLRLTMLNACEGARGERNDPFAGVAQSLVRQGVPAVVAMQFPITDEAAAHFAARFYTALAAGDPVDIALVRARRLLYTEGFGVEWGTPVLYLRGADAQIFDPAGLAETPAPPPHPAAVAPPSQPTVAAPRQWIDRYGIAAFVAAGVLLLLLALTWRSAALAPVATPVAEPATTPAVVTSDTLPTVADAATPAAAEGPSRLRAVAPLIPLDFYRTWAEVSETAVPIGVSDMVIDPARTFAAIVGTDGSVRVYRLADRTWIELLPPGGNLGWDIAAAPDGSLLAVTGFDGSLRIWNVASWSLLYELRSPDGNSLFGAAFSPDRSLVAAGTSRGTILLWRVADGGLTRVLGDADGHGEAVSALAFSPDGALLASGATDPTGLETNRDTRVLIWNVAAGALAQTLTGHTDGINQLAFSPDGALLASASRDDTVMLWRVSDWQPAATLGGHTAGATCFGFSPDGAAVAVGAGDARIRIWRVADGQLMHMLEGSNGAPIALAFGGAERIFSIAGDQVLRGWGPGNTE